MDFNWDSAQTQLFEQVRAGVARDLAHRAKQRSAVFSREDWAVCGRIGLLGANLPEDCGGGGHTLLTTAGMFETFGQACPDLGLAFAVGAHLFACAGPLAASATGKIRAHYAPKLASGEWTGANAITEREAGSDIHALQTTAVKCDGGYHLQGEKSWVTSAPQADVFLVYAKTGGVGMFNLSAFVVEADRPGVRVLPPKEKTGLGSATAAAMQFDCRVPAENLVGEEGQGAVIFNRSMQAERTCLSAAFVGMLQRQLEAAIRHVRSRQQFGRPLAANQTVAHCVAKMHMRLQTARLHLYRACWQVDRGIRGQSAASLAKIAITDAAVESSLDALRLTGSPGYLAGSDADLDLRDSLSLLFASGTPAIQWEIVAKELGL